jgi:large subunit ribosomal protein L1
MAKSKVKTVDMSAKIDEEQEDKREKVDIQERIEAKIEENLEAGKDLPRPMAKARSKAYIAARRNVDRTKEYDLKKAVSLVKNTSYTKFAGTVKADLVVKDNKLSLEMSFPHSTGQTVRVAIATDELLAKVDKGEIDFDVLIATPDMMPKIAKYARVLGPKGLMPNPKNKTVTDDPEKRQKELAAGKVQVKTEKKAPLVHVTIGKTDQSEKELIENAEALIKHVGAKKIRKMVLAATMSPGIKVDLTSYQVS